MSVSRLPKPAELPSLVLQYDCDHAELVCKSRAVCEQQLLQTQKCYLVQDSNLLVQGGAEGLLEIDELQRTVLLAGEAITGEVAQLPDGDGIRLTT